MRIGAAAIKRGEAVHTLPPPARHHDIIRDMGGSAEGDEQGFVTECGVFVTRIAALYIATKANQIIQKTPGRGLFSEDVW